MSGIIGELSNRRDCGFPSPRVLPVPNPPVFSPSADGPSRSANAHPVPDQVEHQSPEGGSDERPPADLKFSTTEPFFVELRRRVDSYFETAGKRRDCLSMYFKSAVIMGWFFGAYFFLLLVASTGWQVLLGAILLGLAMAAIGFNIQHDGGHRAYSRHPWVNRLAAMSLDLLGGSSFVWARKHNSVHHTYANITGHDDDIDLGPIGRLSPHQRRFRFHRLQHWYLWALYGFVPSKWQFYDDFRDLIRGRIASSHLPAMRTSDWIVFLAGKLGFVGLAFILPLSLHAWTSVLFAYAVASFVQGVVLGVVFQLAHCVEETQFPMPDPGTKKMTTDWAVHQLVTTVDFARDNRLLSWYIGGLNFQIEHHLFPQVCHVHYPGLSKVVEQTCAEHGVPYFAHRSLRAGIASHYRWLRRMGREDSPAI